ncbi:OadG family transporter subunit [Opitutus terrae]|uniref:Sodium pump decarboxylase gamma subunit n=1 Tax=Opitutus terrae (strain DSM 11246 / JCM 15787 / PB90-1) TaxID=452637 RepID=B1ZTD3_OPITP|nr:OadG family transporter subunit [Opitutus terrae]ACB76587.1 conserved hypothetical protein [Opitutus terrae PB90-1]
MSSLLPLCLAQAHRPLFGNQWLALLAVLAGVALLMLVVALVGRWLAATHPDPVVAPKAATVSAPAEAVETTPETLAIIAAAVAAHLGAQARITSIRTGGPSVETLMQQWSLEGRRQIYSSHQVR